ncbi:MAG: hypothetical protein H6Q48_2460, partial [Deltaproteobacteria bacterium]|nr:hypothetical protein [Deltaproteobacteria bacterium]
RRRFVQEKMFKRITIVLLLIIGINRVWKSA